MTIQLLQKKYLKKIISFWNHFILIIFIFSLYGFQNKETKDLPNILWLVSEDNSPFLGCYGDNFATTPNLDKMASEGFLYTHAYANAPVCAPARNTIITGVYATSNGNQHMRSNYSISEIVKTYPEFLRKAGYYCTNNSKNDFNTKSIHPKEIWDENSAKAHYKNRPDGKPFFAIFNTLISHESSIHKSIPDQFLRHDPKKVPIPPYHPNTQDIRHDWAQYYDKVEDMDTWVGEKLKELEDLGLADNTIVFYYSDHGGVLPRSKRFIYETGTRVPFIVRIPKKYEYLFPALKPGAKVDRIISLVDLFPTLLSIAGIKIPNYLQGNAFMGDQKTKAPQYTYMFRGRMDERLDMSRAVRDNKFRYIRNYMPYRIYGQHLGYLWRAPSMRSWEEACNKGECNDIQKVFWNTKPSEELYDTENDPWEINNLANDPTYQNVLIRMRTALNKHILTIKDAGFIPETDLIERTKGKPAYDYLRSKEVNFKEIVEAADLAALGDIKLIDQYKLFLKDEDRTIRYWGATGLLILGDKASNATNELKHALNDESSDVVLTAAEALYNLGEKEISKKALLRQLECDSETTRCRALNVIDCIDEESPEIILGVSNMIKRIGKNSKKSYDMRVALWLIKKWNINI